MPPIEFDHRRVLRDRSALMWPERNTGNHYQPGRTAAEVETALARPPRPAAPRRPPTSTRVYPTHYGPRHSVVVPKELVHDGCKYTYAEAGAVCGISGAAMFKRVRKLGWPAAIIMGR